MYEILTDSAIKSSVFNLFANPNEPAFLRNDGENRLLDPVLKQFATPTLKQRKHNDVSHNRGGLVKIKNNHSHDPNASVAEAEDNGGSGLQVSHSSRFKSTHN